MRSARSWTAVAVVGIAFALLASAAGAAKVKTMTFSGTFSEGGTVTFKAKTKTKRVRRKGHTKKTVKVTSILPGDELVINVPITCDEGSSVFTWGFSGDPIKVKRRKFAPTFDDPTTRFSGKFDKKAKEASGIFRFLSDFPPSAHNCNTGTLHWTARR